MTLEEVKHILADLVSMHPKSYSRTLKAKYPEITQFFDQNIKFFDPSISLKTKIYCVLHDCWEFPPKCSKDGCNNDVPHEIGSITAGFHEYCSIKCGNSDPAKLQRTVDTCIREYGVRNVFQSDEVKKVIAQSKFRNHGDPYWNNREKSNATIEQHIKDDPDYYVKIYEKQMQTNVKNGHPPTWSNTEKAIATREQHKLDDPDYTKKKVEKCKQTKLQNHGDPYWNNPEKTKSTKLLRHGSQNYVNVEKCKETKLRNHNDPNFNNHAKYEQTCLTVYGVPTTFLVHDIMLSAKQPYQYDGKMFRSAPELAYYIFLSDHNVSFTYQPECSFTYYCRGVKHQYFPDFMMNDTYEFHEIKGDHFFLDHDPSKSMINPYDRSQDDVYEAKHQCMLSNNVRIITSSQYKVFLDYVANKYGKNFIASLKIYTPRTMKTENARSK